MALPRLRLSERVSDFINRNGIFYLSTFDFSDGTLLKLGKFDVDKLEICNGDAFSVIEGKKEIRCSAIFSGFLTARVKTTVMDDWEVLGMSRFGNRPTISRLGQDLPEGLTSEQIMLGFQPVERLRSKAVKVSVGMVVEWDNRRCQNIQLKLAEQLRPNSLSSVLSERIQIDSK